MRTEMDIYVKKAIIHQFSPSDTDLLLADKYLNITPKIEEYLRKKIERVYSDEAKTGIFTEDNVFLSHITKDFLETSVSIANLWKEEFSVSENQKTNDLIFVQFDKEGVEQILSRLPRTTCRDLVQVLMKPWSSIFNRVNTI